MPDITARLLEELEAARETAIDLAPAEFHVLLRGYMPYSKRHVAAINDIDAWHRELIDVVVAAAKPFGPPKAEEIDYTAPLVDNSNRVACPLCHSRGSQSFGRDGWAVPAGLTMHLNGHGSRAGTEICPVYKTAQLRLVAKIKNP